MDARQIGSLMETLGRDALGQLQLRKFQLVLDQMLGTNAFYAAKFGAVGVNASRDISGWEDFRRLPFTTKKELSADQTGNPPYGSNLSFPRDAYVKIHQTSGTTGEPLRCLDTAESWDWWAECWASVFRAAG
ncbi:MAG: phenylacetate--CoA ligase family protein, partial [Acidimicrobiia bacterium]